MKDRFLSQQYDPRRVEYVWSRRRNNTQWSPVVMPIFTPSRASRMKTIHQGSTPLQSGIDPSRPLVRYHGSKWRLAPWIVGFIPEHTSYVEPYGGGGSVLLRKWRSDIEIYNDLDGEMVNLMKVVRDRGADLCRVLAGTPYSRDEFELSYRECDDEVERARRTIVRSFMGFGSGAISRVKADGARPRIEVLWMNRNLSNRNPMSREQIERMEQS